MRIHEHRHRFCSVFSVILLAVLQSNGAARSEPDSEAPEFARDIRPILSENCFACHGPDSAARQAGLRLDTREGLYQKRSGQPLVVAGDPSSSRLFQRINAEHEALRMPPRRSDKSLTPQQIEQVRRWIEQGAKWQVHWAFIPPRRPEPPNVADGSWPGNPIDRFILAHLEKQGLKPSPRASRETLIRRLTLDLTGLPPTPKQVERFLRDSSPDAYSRLVDRLLLSSRYGERMAMQWLDAARYADTQGYQTDGERVMWRWRDWVIVAYNRNLPFDRFTIEQLAGDLLPQPTLDQRIATGFNRNHRANAEGGIIPEEYLVEYAVDRVETTSAVWMGLTLGCARCHDHKYDPVSQREFYQMMAYFNNVTESGIAFKEGNSEPLIKAPTPHMHRQLDALDLEVEGAERSFQHALPEWWRAQRDWEKEVAGRSDLDWTVSQGLEARFALDANSSKQVKSQHPTQYVSGRIGQAVRLDGRQGLDLGKVVALTQSHKISFGAWVYPREVQNGGILSIMQDDFRAEDFSLHLKDNKVQISFGQRWLDDSIRLETHRSLPVNQWHHVMVTHDGSQRSPGLKIYVNGELQEVNVLFDRFTGTVESDHPLRVGVGAEQAYFVGLIDDVRYYNRVLSPQEVQIVSCVESIGEIAALAPERRSQAQKAKLTAYFLSREAPSLIQDAYRRLQNLRRQRKQLWESIPTSMIMKEREDPRETFLLMRGQYDNPGEKVEPGVPTVLPPLPSDAPPTRVGLAQWLASPENPLTARVAVNRYWQMYFGTGLVKTMEDFGAQGDPPSHPDLLDWLATYFVASGWDIRDMQRLIVTSATYQQSSRVDAATLERDPENRLLSRFPRQRLPAEMIRDQALAVSGLLAERLGGPSVRPYQPPGLWQELYQREYAQDQGDDLYRRSMYTFWKRSVPPPSMTLFDAPSRETCILRRSRTNTPLQALALMNEVTYVEAARCMAERMIREGGASHRDRLIFGFRLVASRSPKADELDILLASLDRQQQRYAQQPKEARKLISVGEKASPQDLPTQELAAYTAVASLLLNLDETITKE